jgi:DNA segregation ATPase FtsK/SpoIIIE, S-DNA-T family
VDAVNAEAGTVRRRHELKGVVWVFFSLFLSLCFLSFSPKDPCLLIREGQTGPAANWMGPVGASLAGWLLAAGGLAAWLLPPGLLLPAAMYFRGRTLPDDTRQRLHLALRVSGLALLGCASSVLLDLALGRINYDGELVRAGGVGGHALAALLIGLIGKAGAGCVIILATVVALMAAFDFSPLAAARLIGDAAFWARERAADLFIGWEQSRDRHKVFEERIIIDRTRVQPQIKLPVDTPIIAKAKALAPALGGTVLQPVNPPKIKPMKKPKQQKFEFARQGEFDLPGVDLLDEVAAGRKGIDQDGLLMNAKILEAKLKDFGVQGEVVEVHPGPVVTMYEYMPGPGIKINKIANLADDLAMALAALSIRIIAPIPGKNVVGIEISNRERETVYFREIIETADFTKSKSPMTMALGKDTVGEPYSFDLRKAPHLLVAGSTGSGKSVGLNSMIMSVLLRATPAQVRMLMIDPKRLELSVYEGIPHLLHPVISDPKDAARALRWAVAEMERRYKLLADQGVRHLDAYNRLVGKDPAEIAKEMKKAPKKAKPLPIEHDTVALEGTPEATAATGEKAPISLPKETLPLIMIVIDELADLMMVAPKEVEESICRLAQMARACGIHLILATQRPSVDVLTGLIKANFPSRISFKVSSKVDSRTILDQNGSERLLGQGDMLFLGPGASKLMRLHGAFVSDQEIHAVTSFIREQAQPNYNSEIIAPRADEKDEAGEEEALDTKWDEAIAVAVSSGQVSVSMLQRKLKIGYNRAARIIECMESQGMVGPSDGVKPRQVLIDAYHGSQLDPMEQSLA